MPERKLRFGVGSADGPQSAVWLVWTGSATSDVFVACRHIATSLKVSLHASGLWRLAFTERYTTMPGALVSSDSDRAAAKWSRPSEFRPGWTHALSVVIPASDLWRPDPPLRLPNDVRWRPAPGPGMESQFAVFLERATGLTARRPMGDVMATFYLPSRENLWVIAADVQSMPENVELYERSRAKARAATGGTGVGSRSLVFGDRPDGARVVIDLYAGAGSP
jgi:hypothetical protein